MLLNQQEKKRLTLLAEMIDPDYQWEVRLLLYNGGKKEYVWNTGNPLGHLLVLPCPIIKVNGKLWQPNPGRTTNGSEAFRTQVWITPSGKEPQLTEVFAEGKGTTEWVVEEGSYKYHLQPYEQLQKRRL